MALVGMLALLLCGCSHNNNANPSSTEIMQSPSISSTLNDDVMENTNMEYKDLNGSWAEKDSDFVVFEIHNNRLTHLINGCIELGTTDFELNDDGEFIFPDSFLAHSCVKRCLYKDGKIIVTEENQNIDFSRVYELYPTKACRYGMVEIIDDEMLQQLQGRWEYDNLFLEFEGNIMRYGENDVQENQLEITVIRDLEVRHWIYIYNKDPNETNLGKYPRLKIERDTIIAAASHYGESNRVFTKV